MLTVIELFAGAGGLALGFERAGFKTILTNDSNKHAINTLLLNRPEWNPLLQDITTIDFTPYKGKVDVITGGFPCQAFSVAGKQLGFKDTRGTLFYEMARAVKECQPKMFLIENVKGLKNHNHGETLATILRVIDEIGYELVDEPRVLNAAYYKVPQRRERLFIVGKRKGMDIQFKWPTPTDKMTTLKEALKAHGLYENDVPPSQGAKYPPKKIEVLDQVPPGGYWRSLTVEVQKSYMGKAYNGAGGSTGMARRLSYDEPSLALTCSPAQKMTERCHPAETRPLTIREYARIQTFPDDWVFAGSMTEQYKQIGNAVPVNLAHKLAISLRDALIDTP